MTLSSDTDFHSKVVTFNARLPAVLIAFDVWRGALGANPVEFVTRATGVLSGTPPNYGTTPSFTVTATDSLNQAGSRALMGT